MTTKGAMKSILHGEFELWKSLAKRAANTPVHNNVSRILTHLVVETNHRNWATIPEANTVPEAAEFEQRVSKLKNHGFISQKYFDTLTYCVAHVK